MSYLKPTLKRNTLLLNKYFTFEIDGNNYHKSLKDILKQSNDFKNDEIKITDNINPEITIYFAKAKIVKNSHLPKITKNNGEKVIIEDQNLLKNILIYTPKNALLEFIF